MYSCVTFGVSCLFSFQFESDVVGDSLLVLLSASYRTMAQELKTTKSELSVAHRENMKLTKLLHKRDETVQKLVKSMNMLKEKFEENDLCLELQRNELKEQEFVLFEMQTMLQIERGVYFFQIDANKALKLLWVFRKHKQNLYMITKSCIREIIRIALEADLVSENVGRCAVKCYIPNHDCADGFYKALQVKIDESPDALELFLRLIQEKLKDCQKCRGLCSNILDDIYSMN